MASNFSSMDEHEAKNIFNENKGLVIERVYLSSKDDEIIHQIFVESFNAASQYHDELLSGTDFSRSSLFLLLTDLQVFQAYKKHSSVENIGSYTPIEWNELDRESQYQSLEVLYSLSLPDQIILILHLIHEWPFEKISDLMKLRTNSVRNRFGRSLRKFSLSSKLGERKSVEKDLPEEDVRGILVLYQEQRIDEMNRLHEANSREISDKVEDEAFRSFYWTNSIKKFVYANRKALALVGVVLLVVLLPLASQLGGESEVVESPSVDLVETGESQEEPISTESQEASFTETVSVPKNYYASDQDRTVFIDPNSYSFYLLEGGESPQYIASFGEEIQDKAGLHYLGLQDNQAYFAFINGEGGVLSLDTEEFTATQYWQTAWFEGNGSINEELESGIIIDNTNYQFE